MYSFLYEKSQTWAVWPNRLSLSRFAEGTSDIIVKQIFSRLFSDVRVQMNNLRDKVRNEMTQLTTSMDKLMTAFDRYLTSAQVDATFARYDYNTSSGSFNESSASSEIAGRGAANVTILLTRDCSKQTRGVENCSLSL